MVSASRSMGSVVVPAAVGFILGGLLSLVGLVLLMQVPDQTLLGAYVIVIFLVAASLTSSLRNGLILGVFAVIGQALTDLIYAVSVYGADLSLLPYAVGFVLFVGRIPLFPLAAAFGGYVGREYFAGKPKKRSGER